MSDTINFNYLEKYSQFFSERICTDYFGTKKYMSGQEIIQLTPSPQVNFMIIKSLFDSWQNELEKLKSNPYFDYRDYAVNEALKEFMNVLSRAIKIEKTDFEPLMKKGVRDTVFLAVDPLSFFEEEIEKSKLFQPDLYFKECKKYLKWHIPILQALINNAANNASPEELKKALCEAYEKNKEMLEPAETLLKPLENVHRIEFFQLVVQENPDGSVKDNPNLPQPDEPEKIHLKEEEQKTTAFQPIHNEEKAIDPALAWAKFESEEYSFMRGSIDNLSEETAINQRFMFTKMLFKGNPELMIKALKSLDEAENFVEAVELLNKNYVSTLDWDIESEEVHELLQMIFRKFDEKS